MCPSPVTHEDLPQAHSYTRAFRQECSNRIRHRIIVVFGPRATILPPVTTGMSFPVWCPVAVPLYNWNCPETEKGLMAIIPNELTTHHMKDSPTNPILVNVVLSNIVCILFPCPASGSRVPTKNATLEFSGPFYLTSSHSELSLSSSHPHTLPKVEFLTVTSLSTQQVNF